MRTIRNVAFVVMCVSLGIARVAGASGECQSESPYRFLFWDCPLMCSALEDNCEEYCEGPVGDGFTCEEHSQTGLNYGSCYCPIGG